jgi:hypothetical protein
MRFLCVAIQIGDRVISVDAPGTHAQMQTALQDAGEFSGEDAVTGFLLENGRFLTRAQAGVFALQHHLATNLAMPPYLSWSDLK